MFSKHRNRMMDLATRFLKLIALYPSFMGYIIRMDFPLAEVNSKGQLSTFLIRLFLPRFLSLLSLHWIAQLRFKEINVTASLQPRGICTVRWAEFTTMYRMPDAQYLLQITYLVRCTPTVRPFADHQLVYISFLCRFPALSVVTFFATAKATPY